ncbi:hypothetical protein [Pacificispira sp.]|uniref:hypothetical protein n=1 Tax=Pacificispira sp. TaxID=2888761 RepID=UPI003B51553E
MSEISVIAPGATIGILGGGQLGRMLAVAAVAPGLSLPYLRTAGRLPGQPCRRPYRRRL